MKTHNEFMEDVEHASSLPAQTQRALAPESQEDIAMYADACKEYREKFDADGTMVLQTKELLSEDLSIEEQIIMKESELKDMVDKKDSGEHISMAKKELKELKYKRDVLCEVNETGGKNNG